MTIARTTWRRLALSAGALGLLVATAHRASAQRSRFGTGDRSRIDTTFTFDKSGTVNVTDTQGDVIVNGSSTGQVHIHAVSDDDNIRLDASSGQVALSVRGSSDSRFEVSVPYGVHVVVHTRTGDVTVRGTHGQVEIRSQTGDIHVDDVTTRLDINTFSGDVVGSTIAGDVEISTTSGDIKLDDVRGGIDIQTVSGDVGLRGVTAKTVRAKTTSGDVVFDGSIDAAGHYELSTNSGDIGLHIPREANAQLTVSTWNGSIDSQFPITLTPGEHGIGVATAKRFTFQVGGGAGRISAETFSGDITISSNGHGAADRR